MDFKQIDVYTNSEAIESLSHILTKLGITGFVVHDSADFDAFLNDKNANWDYVDDDLMKLSETPTYLTFYLPCDNQGDLQLKEIIKTLQALREAKSVYYGNLRLEIDSVREEDWANCWKEYYKPFTIADKIIIKPTWENIKVEDNKLILEIDPASAFGTGQHATTYMCIEALTELVCNGANMLDLGCGSGILSIAALLLGTEHITIIDIAENAVKTASANIEQNNFSNTRYSAYCGDIINDTELRNKLGKFDIITANIVADVIIGLSKFIKNMLNEGGIIIFSGIISERLPEICDVLTDGGLKINGIREKEGWNAIICK